MLQIFIHYVKLILKPLYTI